MNVAFVMALNKEKTVLQIYLEGVSVAQKDQPYCRYMQKQLVPI